MLLLLLGAAAAFYRLIYSPAHAVHGEAAYVLPRSLDVVDTPAEVRSVIAHLKAGERVEVMARTAHWSKLRIAGNESGWVETKYLLDAATYRRGEVLLKALQESVPQAAGHTLAATNLHLEASRDSVTLGELAENRPLEIFARRLVDRPASASSSGASGAAHPRDVWYLVRAKPQAGWVLGRFVDLDVPPGIAPYAQGINMVAWLVLKTVPDAGKNVPEYLVADRVGAESVDFNHVRVFTWWVKNHKYVTAFVESGLAGYFPISARQMTDARYYAQPSPYFRLRLLDTDGHRYQRVYGLFDTIVRPVGTVEGWDSDAMPVPAERAQSRRTRNKRSHKRL